MQIPLDRFEKLCFDISNEVLAQLPPELRADAEQVILLVADSPGPEHLEAVAPGFILLGLYQGVPLINRRADTVLLQPDRITLFRGPISARCRTEVELKAQIRKTLIHELGHYFGFNEEELRQRGWA
jgi:predicted Zn-dependent protease with MMP-like domain